MWLMVVLGARLGALPWGRAPILDPLHRRANLVCSPNVINSRVAALNHNCQQLGAGRVRLQKRLDHRQDANPHTHPQSPSLYASKSPSVSQQARLTHHSGTPGAVYVIYGIAYCIDR